MDNIAVFNAGSSSIKFAIFDNDDPDGILFKGQVENIGVAPKLSVDDGSGGTLIEKEWKAKEVDHKSATTIILETAIGLLGGRSIPAIGHRVVHGGTKFAAPVVISPEVIAQLDELTPLAPLHQPHNIAPIEAIQAAAPHIPQVACFDTAFHQAQPRLISSKWLVSTRHFTRRRMILRKAMRSRAS